MARSSFALEGLRAYRACVCSVAFLGSAFTHDSTRQMKGCRSRCFAE